eukprot:12425480-Karenia_brevis.AAC.1
MHLTDLGGKPAPAKSLLMATSAAHRSWLSFRAWPVVHTTIRVVTNTRDLESHINLGSTTATHLSRERLSSNIIRFNRTFSLPHTLHQKLRFTLQCCHTSAFYACEASAIDEQSLATFTAALTKRMSRATHMHSNAM